jgi:hypothetical protein
MSTDPKDHAISIDDMLKALSDIQDLRRPERLYVENPQRERLADLKKGRGVLTINPEIEELTMFHGYIIDKDGIEYRVLVDVALRGARRKLPEGGQEVCAGYWVKPMNYASLPNVIPMPTFDITDHVHHPTVKQNPEPEPMEMPSLALFDLEEDEKIPEGEVHVKQDGVTKGVMVNVGTEVDDEG